MSHKKFPRLVTKCRICFLLQTWFCNTRASRRKHLKPRTKFQINNEDQEFLNYLIRNQPQILPYFSVSPTPSNFAVGQPQEVGYDPCLAFRQSTGGAYHALCDAIGIDRIDPQQSTCMPSATSGNLTDFDDLLEYILMDQ